jgi:hypothetical protein
MPTGTPAARERPPLRSLRGLRLFVFALLLAAAALTLAGLPALQRAVAEGRWPPATLALPPAVVALFVAGFSVYRFLTVRAGRYPAGKAFVQVGTMLAVLAIVFGVALDRGRREGDGPADLARLLRSGDPEVRAVAAEVLRHRPRAEALAQAARLAALVEDPAPEVRRQAHATLAALAGADVGGTGKGAAGRWRAWAEGTRPSPGP